MHNVVGRIGARVRRDGRIPRLVESVLPLNQGNSPLHVRNRRWKTVAWIGLFTVTVLLWYTWASVIEKTYRTLGATPQDFGPPEWKKDVDESWEVDWSPVAAGRDATFVPLSEAECAKIAATYSEACGSPARLPTSFAEGKLQCDFNLKEDLMYLPDAKLLDCVQRRKPETWKKYAEALVAGIEKLQFPRDCSQPQSSNYLDPSWKFGKDQDGEDIRVEGEELQFSYDRPKWELISWLNHGWAYNLFVFAFNAANHWAAGVPVIVGNSKYRFSDIDCGRGYSCELSELSNCTIDTIPPKSILAYGLAEMKSTVMSVDQLCKPHGKYLMEFGRCDCDEGYLPATDRKYFYCKPLSAFDFSLARKRDHRDQYLYNRKEAIEGDIVWFANNAPGEENPHSGSNRLQFTASSRRLKLGFLWEHAQSLHYLLSRSRRRGAHEAARAKLGLDKGRNLAIHVRHGDSCHDRYQTHRVCVNLATYMVAAKRMELLYGKFDKVFLATDDPKVIKDAKKFSKDFNFVFQEQNRQFYETNDSTGVDVRTDFNAKEKVREITSDIWLMMHCHAFIGSFASSVAWVVYEYMVAHHGHYVPFISIDMSYTDRKNVGRFFEHRDYREEGI